MYIKFNLTRSVNQLTRTTLYFVKPSQKLQGESDNCVYQVQQLPFLARSTSNCSFLTHTRISLFFRRRMPHASQVYCINKRDKRWCQRHYWSSIRYTSWQTSHRPTTAKNCYFHHNVQQLDALTEQRLTLARNNRAELASHCSEHAIKCIISHISIKPSVCQMANLTSVRRKSSCVNLLPEHTVKCNTKRRCTQG
jgi:hypothetical protein